MRTKKNIYVKSVIASGKDTPAQVYTDIPAGGGFTVPVKTINLTRSPAQHY